MSNFDPVLIATVPGLAELLLASHADLTDMLYSLFLGNPFAVQEKREIQQTMAC